MNRFIHELLRHVEDLLRHRGGDQHDLDRGFGALYLGYVEIWSLTAPRKHLVGLVNNQHLRSRVCRLRSWIMSKTRPGVPETSRTPWHLIAEYLLQ